MQEPNQAPDSENLPKPSTAQTNAQSNAQTNAQANVRLQEAKNIFSEIVDDVFVRNDPDTILGVIAIILAILSLVFYISRTFNLPRLLFFSISFGAPALSGWTLRAGFGATGQNKTKFLALGGIALGLIVITVF